MNRTFKYLRPVLQSYGKEFGTMLNSVFKLAYGIGDIITIKSNIKLEKHIFFLVDINIDNSMFQVFQLWIRKQPMFVDDYAYDDITHGHLHMFVILFPEDYLESLEAFKGSHYSQMFTKEKFDKLIIKDEEVKKILVKDHSYLLEFTKKLNEEYGTTVKITPEEITEDFEFDFPLQLEEETFNPINFKTRESSL